MGNQLKGLSESNELNGSNGSNGSSAMPSVMPPILPPAVDEGSQLSVITGVVLTPRRVISTTGGPVLHMLRKDSPLFAGFGEVYFSEVEPGAVKGWKRHKQMVQNFTVPSGCIKFVLFDNRENSPSFGTLAEYELGRPDAYSLLTVPPMIWYSFACVSKGPGLIVNCASLIHSPDESEKVELDAAFIPYCWKV